MISNKVISNFPMEKRDRVSNSMFQKGRSGNSPGEKPTCAKCCKKHRGECLVRMRNCFGYGKEGHNVRDCPNVRSQAKGSCQAQASGCTLDAPKRNHFYALRSGGGQQESPDVVNDMSQVFSFDVYALLDPGATLSFLTPLVARKFDVLPDVLIEPFLASTPVCDCIVARRVFRSFPLSLSNRVTWVDFVELNMVDFYVI